MQRRGYMTKNEEIKTMDNSFMNSKFGKVLLTIVSVFLVFAGPTYVVYGLAVLIKVDLAASFAVGIVLFVIGLIMIRYLVQKKIIS
jgi:tetrahydromethanopterin S-methyltransferase subunit E